MEKTYLCIDLKSFYASVECVKRGLDPLTTNLVVADISRSEKTICLAVSPALKKIGISGRPRLFEVNSKVKEINALRKKKAFKNQFVGESVSESELMQNNNLALSFVIATPNMAQYIKISAKIYEIYLRHVASEDIHVYSIDEVFMDITNYLKLNNLSKHDFAMLLIQEVLKETGITATAGIGTNLYLAKVAMDIVAKHIPADKDGVRIAELDEYSYRKLLWNHRPITDFWRVGRGYAKRLEQVNIFTMGDIALCSLGKNTDKYNEDLLYKLFGVNAELLIDHAWGYEPCTIKEIKAYKPENSTMGSGQVLHEPYETNKAKMVAKEMVEQLILDLISKHLVTNYLVMSIGYETINAKDKSYQGEIKKDYLGRDIPKHGHGSVTFKEYTSSRKLIMNEAMILFDKIVNPKLLIRRLYITCGIADEDSSLTKQKYEQLNLFEPYQEKKNDEIDLKKEKQVQETIIKIKKRFGKNSIMKAMDLQEGATAKERNEQIGGHKA